MELLNESTRKLKHTFCTNNPEEWLTMLSTMEVMHNNWQHADWLNTLFELMLGITPVAIPLAFEHTKYPSIEEKMNNLIKNWEEALAAHELARTHMAGRWKDTFTPFKKGQKVWLDSCNLKTSYHKKIGPKHEGLFEIEEVLGPCQRTPSLTDPSDGICPFWHSGHTPPLQLSVHPSTSTSNSISLR